MPATPFADLPVKDSPWGNKTTIENEVLGDPPNWDRYKKAHLWFDPKRADSKAGYKLPVARMLDGTLTVIRSQLGAAIAALNGARGGVDIPGAERRAAYNLAVRYLKKFDPKLEPPALKGQKMDTKLSKQGNNGNPETKTIDVQTAARSADGPFPGGGVATNLDELAKRLSDLRKADGDESKTDTSGASDADENSRKLDADEWPDDMNDPAFVERGEVDGPEFGADPDLSAADADE